VSSAVARTPAARALARLALGALALIAIGADWRTPSQGEGPETAAVRTIEGRPYLGVNDLARLLDATKYWRGDLRRLELRAPRGNVTLTAGNPFAVVGDRTLWLGDRVRVLAGELQVPAALVDSLPPDPSGSRLFFDARRARVVELPPSGGVGTPRIVATAGGARVIFPVDRPEEAVVVARGRAHLRVRFGGVFTGVAPESLPPGGLVRALRPIAAAGGSAFELEIAAEAAGFRLGQDAGARRVTLELARDPAAGFEAFAPEGAPGPRDLRVIVLDPGHGGRDAGVVSGDAVEKDLALTLARFLRDDLQRRLPARVVLTRDHDRDLHADERAEIANRSRADLVLALHFDGHVDARARGVTCYIPPATYAAGAARDGARGATRGAAPLLLLPWRDVAVRHAVPSRALAEALLSSLELRGQGPARLRERLPDPLLGVNAPGVLLECATLTAPGDRDRVMQEEGLRQLAAAIADGVEAYRRNQ
jgi:N-acetylmuramoyl-L-alanine amidase